MSNDKKSVPVEKHYERRWLEAKSEMIKDAGPVIDFFINMHAQCAVVADKYNVSTFKLTEWVIAQLPIDHICTGDEEEEDAVVDDE